MFKIMITLKRKSGLSRAEFMDLYENGHVPLARRLVSPLELYRRNYIVNDDPFLQAIGDNRATESSEPPFDVITEISYETREQAIAAMRERATGVSGKEILADEAKFVDVNSLQFYVVDVHQTSMPW